MSCKRFYRLFFLLGGKVVTGIDNPEPLEEPKLVNHLSACEDAGADGAIVYMLSRTDKERDKSIKAIKECVAALNISIIAGGNVERFEDAKKILYAGCDKVVIDIDDGENFKAVKETAKRFGKDRVVGFTRNVHFASGKYDLYCGHEIDDIVGTFLFDPKTSVIPSAVLLKDAKIPVIPILSDEDISKELLTNDAISGFTGPRVENMGNDIYEYKLGVKEKFGVEVDILEPNFKWSDFKTNDKGLVPVVIQSHKTDEVLMVGYMNEESFALTLKTRKMTYFSRSRQKLWTKGETSGNYQYVKSLSLDCDNDTILARVIQIGVPCHTGNKTCFYKEIVNDNLPSVNPYKVFEDVYAVVKDRKKHPKENSYTNYLFDKGIDKILKKLGEEATEIVIAAKNPDPEEIKYEMADFLYHAMVLMVERGVTWEDITDELSKR